MSDTDSFIDEVTEEVRRDRMFFMLKRYGWIAVPADFFGNLSGARPGASIPRRRPVPKRRRLATAF
jgi:hypothetical protein